MSSVITVAFENWKAQEAATGKPVLLNEFVFANIPGLDPTKPIDRNEKLPPANQIVHRQAVNKAGLASENAVAYSVTLGAEVGNFDFNWIGLLNKESGTIAMITHAPTQKKLKTQNGQQGNVLTRSFLLEFQGAAKETQITTTAETWQIDFTARLSGIDEMQRLINVDSYGAAAFFNDGFEVTRSAEQFTVKKGLGYVGGLRGELAQNQILNNLRNTKVYADFSYQGNIVSKWNTVVKITAAATLNNYVDAAGFTHQVFAIASIDASGNIKDLRPMGALSSQEISALETRFKLDLSKKIDKANITSQTGNSTELVVSQHLLTTELGKKQPAGNYAPAGDYATNTALKNGLNEKFDKTGGTITRAGAALTLRSPIDRGSVYHQLVDTDGTRRGFVGFGSNTNNDLTIKNDDENINITLGSRGATINGVKILQTGDFGVGDISPILSNEGLIKATTNTHFRQGGGTGNNAFTSYGAGLNNAYSKTIRSGYFIKHATTELYIYTSRDDVNAGALKIAKVYSDLNTKTDRNGNLKVSSSSDALSDCPVGSPIPWPQATAPTGFLVCNGQAFNKTTYPLLATAYPSGKLPDLRSEFIRGLDAGRNIDSVRTVLSAQGDAIRDITGEIQGMNMSGSGAFGDRTTVAYSMSPNGSGKDQFKLVLKASNVVPTANENRPRNIAFLYIVRAA
ncbi:phage tail protein [Providencia sp.]|uniref:phage tail-collar fiber domain-containing protein n=1 Tax=Providencia sp. TaxID=589 RepID=UPI00333E4155